MFVENEAHRVLAISLDKIQNIRKQRTSSSLHKNLLVTKVLDKVRGTLKSDQEIEEDSEDIEEAFSCLRSTSEYCKLSDKENIDSNTEQLTKGNCLMNVDAILGACPPSQSTCEPLSEKGNVVGSLKIDSFKQPYILFVPPNSPIQGHIPEEASLLKSKLCLVNSPSFTDLALSVMDKEDSYPKSSCYSKLRQCCSTEPTMSKIACSRKLQCKKRMLGEDDCPNPSKRVWRDPKLVFSDVEDDPEDDENLSILPRSMMVGYARINDYAMEVDDENLGKLATLFGTGLAGLGCRSCDDQQLLSQKIRAPQLCQAQKIPRVFRVNANGSSTLNAMKRAASLPDLSQIPHKVKQPSTLAFKV